MKKRERETEGCGEGSRYDGAWSLQAQVVLRSGKDGWAPMIKLICGPRECFLEYLSVYMGGAGEEEEEGEGLVGTRAEMHGLSVWPSR